MTTTSETGSQRSSTTSAAQDEGRRVGQVLGEEAQNVGGETASQVRDLVDEARTQVEEQSRTQRDRLVETLSTFSSDLEEMSSGHGSGQGPAADLVRSVSQRARDLSRQLEGREPRELLDDLRAFARRRPGTFLLGSLAAGLVAGRLLRGAKDSAGTSTGGDTTSTSDGLSVQRSGPAFDPSQADLEPATPAVGVDEPLPATSRTKGVGDKAFGDPVGTEPSGDIEPGVHRGTR